MLSQPLFAPPVASRRLWGYAFGDADAGNRLNFSDPENDDIEALSVSLTLDGSTTCGDVLASAGLALFVQVRKPEETIVFRGAS